MITLNIYQLKCNRKTYEGYYKYGASDWVVGQHTAILGKVGAIFMFKLMQGDCLELMKDIPDGSIDLIVTDPPYLMNYRSNYRKVKYDYIIGDKDGKDLIAKSIKEAYRVLKDNSLLS